MPTYEEIEAEKMSAARVPFVLPTDRPVIVQFITASVESVDGFPVYTWARMPTEMFQAEVVCFVATPHQVGTVVRRLQRFPRLRKFVIISPYALFASRLDAYRAGLELAVMDNFRVSFGAGRWVNVGVDAWVVIGTGLNEPHTPQRPWGYFPKESQRAKPRDGYGLVSVPVKSRE